MAFEGLRGEVHFYKLMELQNVEGEFEVRRCKTAKEFGEALKDEENYIIIEGDLSRKVIRIKAVGPVAWGVCVVALGAAIAFYSTTPTATVVGTPVAGTANLVMGTTALAAATSSLGAAVVPAVIIGVTAGGVGVLSTLRDKYRIVEKDKKYIKLQRK